MLRLIFVSLIIAFGTKYALKGAFGALLLYLWVAYFRPHLWAHNSSIIGALDLSLFAGVYLLVRSITSNRDRFRFDFRTLFTAHFHRLECRLDAAVDAERVRMAVLGRVLEGE